KQARLRALATTATAVSRKAGSTRTTRVGTAEQPATDKPRSRAPVDPGREPIYETSRATRTLVEYGDYQCPFGGAAYPEVKKAQKELGSKLRLVFRNFPLTRMHEFALNAAETAEASSAQGKFWEMHDFLYEHQRSLGDPGVALEFANKLRVY